MLSPDTERDFNKLSRHRKNIAVDEISTAPSELLGDVSNELVIRSRIKYGTKSDACIGILMEYSNKSSIHGIRYIFEKDRSITERLIWIVMFAVSMYASIALIIKAYNRWIEFPVIVSFKEKSIRVHEIPFPSILVCPEVKFDAEIFNFTDVYNQVINLNGDVNNGTISEQNLEMMSAALHVCDIENLEEIGKHIPQFDPNNTESLLRSIIYSKNNTLPACKWNQHFRFCENIFSSVPTDEGICFQFNGLDRAEMVRDQRYLTDPNADENEYHFEKIMEATLDLPEKERTSGPEWTLDKGYASWALPNAYPQRNIHGGSKSGLVIVLFSLESNIDYMCRASIQGYKVRLQSPDDVAVSLDKFVRIPLLENVILTVTPEYITTSEGLRSYSPEQRQCFFNEERYLRYYKTYTQDNCEFECLINYTISKCGCVKYYMPKPEDIPICGLKDIMCYNEAKDELLQLQFEQEVHSPEGKSQCNCLPSCVSLNYHYEVSQAKYDVISTLNAWKQNYSEEQMGSLLNIQFKNNQFFAVKRTELFGLASFVAVCGGILSLLMGISMLSVVEIAYFFTVRLISNINMRKDSLKKRHIFRDNKM